MNTSTEMVLCPSPSIKTPKQEPRRNELRRHKANAVLIGKITFLLHHPLPSPWPSARCFLPAPSPTPFKSAVLHIIKVNNEKL